MLPTREQCSYYNKQATTILFVSLLNHSRLQLHCVLLLVHLFFIKALVIQCMSYRSALQKHRGTRDENHQKWIMSCLEDRKNFNLGRGTK